MDNLTAKVSCFARAYHYRNNDTWIFKDDMAERLLKEEEYKQIADNMAAGISFFCPTFDSTKEDALDMIVNNTLSPSVLARSAFTEDLLADEIKNGCRQYVIFASGYDTYTLRKKQDDVKVFELDLPCIMNDKIERLTKLGLKDITSNVFLSTNLAESTWCGCLQESGFVSENKVFGSLLGISYYLEKKSFSSLLKNISRLWKVGSKIAFDFPLEDDTNKNEELASAAGEKMKAKYTYQEMERLLGINGFKVMCYYDESKATENYFKLYNKKNPLRQMKAPKNVGYILASRENNNAIDSKL